MAPPSRPASRPANYPCHPMWYISEIMEEVVAHCKPHLSTLASCARVCHSLSEPSLAALWEVQRGIRHLFALLPETTNDPRNTWTLVNKFKDTKYVSCITVVNEIARSNIPRGRPQLYAAWTRENGYDSKSMADMYASTGISGPLST